MEKSNSTNLWFILGREYTLCAAELAAALNTQNYSFNTCIFKAKTNHNPHKLINDLGGTIKIGEELGSELTEPELIELIIKELKTIEGKIHFGVSVYSNEQGTWNKEQVRKIGLEIKKQLKDQGFSVRYVENREPVLSSVTVEKNGLTKRGREFLISIDDVDVSRGRKSSAPTNGVYSIAKTIAVQPFEEWSKRDFGRPGRDDKSGMLPPKLARIMINLAGRVGAIHELPLPNNGILLDPFCGSGTILTEALHLGYKYLIGTDISEKAITDTKKNIEWAKNNEQLTMSNEQISINIFQRDIKNLAEKISPSSVDAIVTEPYLGKPLKGNESKTELEKQAFELKNLYIQAFEEFYKILKTGGTIIFIVPRFKYRREWICIDCFDQIKKIGFSIKPFLKTHEFLLYARENQRVGREIWGFEKV